jgi:hypothetical protein
MSSGKVSPEVDHLDKARGSIVDLLHSPMRGIAARFLKNIQRRQKMTERYVCLFVRWYRMLVSRRDSRRGVQHHAHFPRSCCCALAVTMELGNDTPRSSLRH